jgi:hypothetical protein
MKINWHSDKFLNRMAVGLVGSTVVFFNKAFYAKIYSLGGGRGKQN